MKSQVQKKVQEKDNYTDIEELIKESLSDKAMSDEKEDMVLEYLCQTISKTDSGASLEEKAKKGDSYAYIQLASYYIAHAQNIKDYCKAFRYASKAAKHGYVEAYYILGQLYLYGVGCNKNVHKAVRYLSSFAKQITKKELLNEDVLFDAYVKLAEAEKSLNHFDKARSYYEKLKEYDSRYDAYAKEMQDEMQKRHNSYLFSSIFLVCGFVLLCAAIYFLLNYVLAQTDTYASRYPQKEAITMVEQEAQTTEAVPPKQEEKPVVQEPLTYALVSEEEFLALSLSEINVADAASTSEYISRSGNYYGASNLIDHNSATSWQEGEADTGIGQSLTFRFEEPAIVSAIRLQNGNGMNNEKYYENNRAASLQILDENNDLLLIELPDTPATQYLIFENPVLRSEITLTLGSVFAGTKWNDTCISEITFYE